MTKKDEYLNSLLFIDYELFILFKNINKVDCVDILKYREYMNSEQIYKSYLITGIVNDDIESLQMAKSIKTTAEVVYKIADIKWINGKYYEAIELYLESLSLSYEEGNIKEQIKTCIMIGNLYLEIDLWTMQKYYDKALLLCQYTDNNDFNHLIYYHMGIAYTSIDFDKSKGYFIEALELCKSEDVNSLEKIYQKLCFLYLRYDKRENININIYYNKAKEINMLKNVNSLIKVMIDNRDYIHLDVYLTKLIQIYNYSKKHRKHSNTKYYGNLLIEAYKMNRKYKDALAITEYLYRNRF